MSEERGTLTVATLNVHGWVDAGQEDNVERVADLVKKHDPDILCLQETHREDRERFLQMTPQFKFTHTKFSCSVLSKFPGVPTSQQSERRERARFASVKLKLPAGDSDEEENSRSIHVTSIHLDHRKEPTRLIEIAAVKKFLDPQFASESPQIWTGDFNALTREDYTDAYWNERVVEVRERNLWESPKTELTAKVKSLGFKDTWELAGRPDPVSTCRFDTRIDYVYATPSLLDKYPLISVEHVDDKASDHNMVVAKFKM